MLCRKHDFFTGEEGRVFTVIFLDKIEFHCDEYRKNLESTWNTLLVVYLAKSYNRFVRKQRLLNSSGNLSTLQPQGLLGGGGGDFCPFSTNLILDI